MPTVPGTAAGLIPDVNPQGGTSTPNISVEAPVAAFGGSVGLALQNLGTNLEADTAKIWDRAVELQGIQNRTAHDNAEAEFIKQSSLLNAEFTAKQGVNAGPQALEEHAKQLEDLRTQIGSTLTTADAQRMYDRTSKDTTARYVANATSHSVSQVRSAYSQGLALKEASFGQEMIDHPDDPVVQQKFEAAARLRAQDKGLAGDDVNEYVKVAKGAVAGKILDRLAEENPDAALSTLRDYKANGTLRGEEFTTAERKVNNVAYATKTVEAAERIYSSGIDDNQQKMTLGDMQKQGDRQAEQDFPGDVVYQKKMRQAVDSRFSQGLRAEKNQAWNDWQTVSDLQMAGARSLPMLLSDPDGRAAFDRLPASKQKQITDGFTKIAITEYRAADKQAREDNYKRLSGMANSDDPAVRAQFMDVNLQDERLGEGEYNRLLTQRKAVLKNIDADPRTGRAMKQLRESDLGARMQGLGVYSRDKRNADDYDGFVGTLHTALEDWQTENGKPATSKEIHDIIAPQIMQGYLYKSWGGFGPMAKGERFSVVPEEFAKAQKKSFAAQGQPEPTDWEIRRAYVHYTMTTLYKSATKDKAGM